jgi:hypothetical protein
MLASTKKYERAMVLTEKPGDKHRTRQLLLNSGYRWFLVTF